MDWRQSFSFVELPKCVVNHVTHKARKIFSDMHFLFGNFVLTKTSFVLHQNQLFHIS